jgi:hypothetical protein
LIPCTKLITRTNLDQYVGIYLDRNEEVKEAAPKILIDSPQSNETLSVESSTTTTPGEQVTPTLFEKPTVTETKTPKKRGRPRKNK